VVVAAVDIVGPGLPDLPARAIQGAIEVSAFPACHVAVGGDAALHPGDAGLLPVELARLAAGDLAGASARTDTMMLAVLPGIHPAADVRSAVVISHVPWVALGKMSMTTGAICVCLFALFRAFPTCHRALALAALFDACAVTLLHACAAAIAVRQGGPRERKRYKGGPDHQSVRRLHDAFS